MERRWLDHAYATPIFTMATIPQYRDHFRGYQASPAKGKRHYPEMSFSLDRALVLSAQAPSRAILDPKQIVVFEVKQPTSLGAHLEELERIGLRAARFWEGVYFDQIAEVGAVPDQALHLFGDVLRVVGDNGPLADRIPLFLRRSRQLGLITFSSYQEAVPPKTLYLAVQELSRWGL